MSRAVPSGRREGMFPGRYSEIFGLGERLGCILNLGHSFDAIEAYLYLLVCCYAGASVLLHQLCFRLSGCSSSYLWRFSSPAAAREIDFPTPFPHCTRW